jgi:integrase
MRSNCNCLRGARLGEVLNARREAFDLERSVWTKPSHQTKQRKTEYVPLSPQALDLVAMIFAEQDLDDPWLFPGNVPGQPLRDIKKFWSGIMQQAGIKGYRRHDNRHTYASHLVSGGLSLKIVGRLLVIILEADHRRLAESLLQAVK